MPQKSCYIKFIDGKIIKRNHTRLREGQAVGRGNIRFNLEEEVFLDDNPRLRKWSYDGTSTPKMSILRVANNSKHKNSNMAGIISKLNNTNDLRKLKHHSMPITASIIRCIDGKMVRKRKLSQENLKATISKSRIKFNSLIEIWDHSY